MSRRHLYLLAAFLTALGTGVFLYKVLVLDFPIRPDETIRTWRVEARVRFQAGGSPVRLKLNLPQDGNNLVIVDRNFVSPGYGITTRSDRGNSVAEFAIRRAQGQQTVYYRALVHQMRFGEKPKPGPVPLLPEPQFTGAEKVAAETLVSAARAQSADAESFAALLLKRLRNSIPGDEADLLVGRQPTPGKLVDVTAKLLRLDGIAARPAHGLTLELERTGAHLITWLEIYDGHVWVPIFPAEARPVISGNLLRWWQGRGPLVSAQGANALSYTVAVSRSYEHALDTVLKRGRRLEQRLVEYSLFGLPLQTQSVYRSVLVIPVGLLLLVLLRNVVGVKTFGTFMPVLIALAFRQTGLMWGIAFFAVVVAIGLLIRFYLEQLKLLLVPRLAAVVIVVVLTLASLSVLSHKLGVETGLSIGLFPIIILAMTIERMSIVWEERGPFESLQQALGSLLAGAMCFLVMTLPIVEHLVFVFPELLLVLLAAVLLLGRYSGYRLSELLRFRELAQ